MLIFQGTCGLSCPEHWCMQTDAAHGGPWRHLRNTQQPLSQAPAAVLTRRQHFPEVVAWQHVASLSLAETIVQEALMNMSYVACSPARTHHVPADQGCWHTLSAGACQIVCVANALHLDLPTCLMSSRIEPADVDATCQIRKPLFPCRAACSLPLERGCSPGRSRTKELAV